MVCHLWVGHSTPDAGQVPTAAGKRPGSSRVALSLLYPCNVMTRMPQGSDERVVLHGSRPLPGPREALLYLQNNGVRRSLAKLMAGYVLGRQRWYLTREDLMRYAAEPPDAGEYELRFATPADLPHMDAFGRRMPAATLESWLGARFFFFLALRGGRPVSYRCLSTVVHPGVAGFVRLRPDQVFMVDEFTVPPLRRRGITRRMAVAMAPALAARGYRQVLGIHRVDNHDTIAAARAKGVERLGVVTRWCLLQHAWFTFAPETAVAPAPLLAQPDPAATV